MAAPLFVPARGRPPPPVGSRQREAKSREPGREQHPQRVQQPTHVGMYRQRILLERSTRVLLLLVVLCACRCIILAAAIHFTSSAALRNVLAFAVYVLASSASPFPVPMHVRTRAASEDGDLRVEVLLHTQEQHGTSHLPPATFLDAGSVALPLQYHQHQPTYGNPQPHEHDHDHRGLSSQAARAAAVTKEVPHESADVEQMNKTTASSQRAGDAVLHHQQPDIRRDSLSLSADGGFIPVYRNPPADTFATSGSAAGNSVRGSSGVRLPPTGDAPTDTAAGASPYTWIYPDTQQRPSSGAAGFTTFADHASEKDEDDSGADGEGPTLTAARLYAAASIFVCAIAGALPPLLLLQRQQESRSNRGNCVSSSNCSSRSGAGGDTISISTARYIRLTMSFTGGVLLAVGLLHLLPSAERQIAASRRTYAFFAAPSAQSHAAASGQTGAVSASPYPSSSESRTATDASSHLVDLQTAASALDHVKTGAHSAVAAAAAETSHKNRQPHVQQSFSSASRDGRAPHMSSLPEHSLSPEQRLLLTQRTYEQLLQQQQTQKEPSPSLRREDDAPAAGGAGSAAAVLPSRFPGSSPTGAAGLVHPPTANLFDAPSAVGGRGAASVAPQSAAATGLRIDTRDISRAAATAALPAAADAQYLQPPAAAASMNLNASPRDTVAAAPAEVFAPAARAAWQTERESDKNGSSSSSFLPTSPITDPPPLPPAPPSPVPPQPTPAELPYPLASLCCLCGVLLVMALEAVAEAEHAHHPPHTHTHARTHALASDVHGEQWSQQQQPQQHVIMVSSVKSCSVAKAGDAKEQHQQHAHVQPEAAELLRGGLTPREKQTAVAEGETATAADAGTAPAAGADGATTAADAAAARVRERAKETSEVTEQPIFPLEVREGRGVVETGMRRLHVHQNLETLREAEQRQQEQRRAFLLLSSQDQHGRSGAGDRLVELQEQQQHRSQPACARAERQAEQWGATVEEKEEVKVEWSAAASAPAAAEAEAQASPLSAQHARPLCNSVCSPSSRAIVYPAAAATAAVAAGGAALAAGTGGGRAGGGAVEERATESNAAAIEEDLLLQEQQREGAASSPIFSSSDAQIQVSMKCLQLPQGGTNSSSNSKSSNSGSNSKISGSVRSPSEKREGAEESALSNEVTSAGRVEGRQLPRWNVTYTTSCSAGRDFSTSTLRRSDGGAAAAACVKHSPLSAAVSAAAAADVGRNVGAATACRSAPLRMWGSAGQAAAARTAAATPAWGGGICDGRQKYRCCKIQRETCCRVLQSKAFPLSRSGYASGCAFTAAAELCALSSDSPCCGACMPSGGRQQLPSSSSDCDAHSSGDCVDSSGSSCACNSSCSDNSSSGGLGSSNGLSHAGAKLASPLCTAWQQCRGGAETSSVYEAAGPFDTAPSGGPSSGLAASDPPCAACRHAGKLERTADYPEAVVNCSDSLLTSQPLQRLQGTAVARSSSDPSGNSSSSSSGSSGSIGNRLSSLVNGLSDALLLRTRGRSVTADFVHEPRLSTPPAAAAARWEGKSLAGACVAAAGAAAPWVDSRVPAVECRRSAADAAATERSEGRKGGTASSASVHRCFVLSRRANKSSSSRSSSRGRHGNTRRKKQITSKAQQWCFWKRTDNFSNTSSSSSLCFPLLATSHSCCSYNVCSRSSGPCDSCSSGPDCGPLCSADSAFPSSYGSRQESLMFCGRNAVASAATAAVPAAEPGAAHGERAADSLRLGQQQRCALQLGQRHHKHQHQHRPELAQQQQQQGYLSLTQEGQQAGVRVAGRPSRCTYIGSACCRSRLCVSRSRSRLSGCGRCSSNDEGSLLPPYGTSSSSASFADELDTQSREGRGGGAKNMLVSSVLMLALSFHSLMEGVTLGTTLRPHVVAFAVLVHKGLESFALGSSLLQTQTRLRTFLWQMGLFALMTPVGVVLGLSIALWTEQQQQHQLSQLRYQRHFTPEEQAFPVLQQQQQLSSFSPVYLAPVASLISWYYAIAAAARAAAEALLPLLPGMLTGIGSGTFLHVSLLECVAPQLMRSRAEGKASLLAVIAAVTLGAALMSVLA